jgi:hypothetical protein
MDGPDSSLYPAVSRTGFSNALDAPTAISKVLAVERMFKVQSLHSHMSRMENGN